MTETHSKPKGPRQALVLAGLVAVGLAMSVLLRQSVFTGEDLSEFGWAERILAEEGYPVGGNPDGDVTVMVFTDYACGICRISDPELERAAKEDGNVRIVYRLWPVFGPPSERAARLAMAADRQGVFSPFHTELLASAALSPQGIRATLKQAGGNWSQAQADLTEHGDAIDAAISATHQSAFRISLRGTPGYLVGPYLLRGKGSEGMFKKAFERAREKQAQ
ncbi:DsbA family protein [Erythrobacter sp. W53]|uniref:DsbA family protein n=1 Tax=Erythrobacter sp. W53 TaxID=3425947 RepID=UPI003D766CBA